MSAVPPFDEQNLLPVDAMERELLVLRAIVDALPESVYVKDVDGRYILDNPQHRRFLGVTSSEEVIGRTVFDFFPSEFAAAYHADDVDVIRSGEPLRHHEEITVTGWLVTTKIPFRNGGGQVAGLVCISRDVTEVRNASATGGAGI